MLPKDLLDKVPTLNELLEHPRVREVAQSWNESTLVAKARGALLELGSEISRRSESWSEASPRELFDRVLHLLDRPDAPPFQEIINGTGKISSDAGWKQVPLSDEVITYAARQANLFTSAETTPSNPEASFKRLTKAESTIVASSYLTAHEAFLMSISNCKAEGGAIVVGRPDMGSVEPGHRLLTLCESNQVRVVEVGTAEQATTNDYLEAIATIGANEHSSAGSTDRQAWVYLGVSQLKQLVAEPTALAEFIATLQKNKARIAVGLENASPCELLGALDVSLLTASKACELGFDLVFLRGNGMVGGPAIGLLAGKKESLEPIAESLRKRHWQASDWDSVLLEATLTLFDQPGRLPFRHRIAGLLDAPIDNLRTRSERLAQRIEAAETIVSAEPFELIDRQVGPGLRLGNSWGIRLTPSCEGGAVAFAEGMRHATPQLWGEIQGDGFIIDLKTVMPSQDLRMVCAISGNKEA